MTGAGISVSPPANIPDFRSSTGLFKRLKEKHPSAGLTSGKDLFDARLFQVSENSLWMIQPMPHLTFGKNEGLKKGERRGNRSREGGSPPLG